MLAKAYQEIIVRTGHMPSAVLAIPTDHRLILSKQKCQNKSGTVTRRGEARSGRGVCPKLDPRRVTDTDTRAGTLGVL